MSQNTQRASLPELADRQREILRAVIREMLGRLGLSHFALVPSTADVPGPEEDLGAERGKDIEPCSVSSHFHPC